MRGRNVNSEAWDQVACIIQASFRSSLHNAVLVAGWPRLGIKLCENEYTVYSLSMSMSCYIDILIIWCVWETLASIVLIVVKSRALQHLYKTLNITLMNWQQIDRNIYLNLNPIYIKLISSNTFMPCILKCCIILHNLITLCTKCIAQLKSVLDTRVIYYSYSGFFCVFPVLTCTRQ